MPTPPRAGEVLPRAEAHMRGVLGGIALHMTARRGVPKPLIKAWVPQLRAAATDLERLIQ